MILNEDTPRETLIRLDTEYEKKQRKKELCEKLNKWGVHAPVYDDVVDLYLNAESDEVKFKCLELLWKMSS